MKSITRQKRTEEIKRMLGSARTIAVVGCGTCPAMAGTGGVKEVEELARRLEDEGVETKPRAVLTVACESLAPEAEREFTALLQGVEAVLVTACSLGVRMVAESTILPMLPALNTLFIGREAEPGLFVEECAQCGDCVLRDFGGICPICEGGGSEDDTGDKRAGYGYPGGSRRTCFLI
ncbi:MAG: methylenetetrahydrofolate reductase C-terminal domain-containing protein [Actinobacteria bacterium]|nr:methylenetetrahydrofolate reductase C-terminal domain-containing protein [Actinomycetota bacterium]